MNIDRSFEVVTLSNQFRLLFIEVDHSLVHVQIDISTGHDDELTSEFYEVSHVLEHMQGMFTSDQHRNSKEVEQLLDQLSVTSNAHVSNTRSSFYMRGHERHLPTFLPLFCRSFTHFHFDAERFPNEKKAIECELRDHLENVEYEISEEVNALSCQHHPRAVHELLHLENVPQITKCKLLEFRKQFYTSDNMLFTIVAKSDVIDEWKLKLSQWFASLSPSIPVKIPAPYFESAFIHNTVDQPTSVHIRIRYPLHATWFDMAAQIQCRALEHILTDGLSSRLLRLLRVENGLVYSVRARATMDYRDKLLSFFDISATTKSVDNAHEVVRHVTDVLSELAVAGPTDDEMLKWRNAVETSFVVRSLTNLPQKWCNEYSPHVLFRRQVVTNERRRTMAMQICAVDVHDRCVQLLSMKPIIFFQENRKNFP